MTQITTQITITDEQRILKEIFRRGSNAKTLKLVLADFYEERNQEGDLLLSECWRILGAENKYPHYDLEYCYGDRSMCHWWYYPSRANRSSYKDCHILDSDWVEAMSTGDRFGDYCPYFKTRGEAYQCAVEGYVRWKTKKKSKTRPSRD